MVSVGLAASLFMGFVLGLMGGGGSILTVPIMVYLFQLQPTLATGHSLFVVGLTALIGSVSYIRKGDVDIRRGLVFAVPSLIGVSLARRVILPALPAEVLRLGNLVLTKDILVMTAFAVLMVAASLSMLSGRKEANSGRKDPKVLSLGLLGLAVGLTVGFVGAGGGFLIVPALVVLAGMGMRVAVGTSLLIIAAQSLWGFAGDVWQDMEIQWRLLFMIASLSVTGILLGSRISHRIPEWRLKKLFGWFVLVMGSMIFMEQIRHL